LEYARAFLSRNKPACPRHAPHSAFHTAGTILAALLLALNPATAADQKFVIYPQDYAVASDGRKTVGEYGQVVEVEDEDGEPIEVVEFAVPRSVQREKDVLLFTTAQPPLRSTNFLNRTYTGWAAGTPREMIFREPDVADRTIYRRGSEAHDNRIAQLYETAVLNGLIAKIGWFSAMADTNARPRAPLARLLSEHNEYLKMRRHKVTREGAIRHLRGLLAAIEKIPAWQKEAEDSRKRLDLAAARQKTLAAELSDLESRLGGRSEPRGDPDVRRRDILKIEEYEARADVRYEQQRIEKNSAMIERVVSNALASLNAPGLGNATQGSPDPASLAKDPLMLKAALESRLSAEEKADAGIADPETWLVSAAREISDLMKSLASTPSPDQNTARFLEAWKKAESGRPLIAETQDALAQWRKAVDAIPTVDFGRYRVTLLARLQGVPQCIGTPIVLSAAGIEKRFYSYQWPDTENYHKLSFDVEVREPPDFMLEYALPSRRGGWGLCRDLDHYNETRLKGWEMAGETSLDRLVRRMFERADRPAEQVAADWALALYRTCGTFDVSLRLHQARRHATRTGSGLRQSLGGPDASLDSLFVDSITVEGIEEPPLTLRQALVQKNWIKPGWDNNFMAWIHNRTGAEQTGRLKTSVVAAFNDARTIDEREVRLPPRSFARVVVPWTSSTNEASFGREVRMELSAGGAVTRACDVFTVHPNCFSVYIADGALGYDVYRGPKTYNNNVETFGITPGDSVGVLPDDVLAPVPSGMSDGAVCHIPHLRAGACGNHKLGVGYTHYLSPLCTGAPAYRWYLKHPEWWPSRLTWTEQMNDNWTMTEKLYRERYYAGESLDGISSNYPLLHLEQPVNHGCRELFEHLVEEMVTYHLLVDWDGTRWDGGPLSVFPKDFLGRSLPHPETGEPVDTPAACKELGARLFAELKKRMWQVKPGWVYGNNGDSDGYGGTLINLEQDPPDTADYPQFVEFMKDHGAYMDEGWMSAYIFGDTRNKVERYLRICFKESMVMKKRGGNLWTFSPERDGSPYFNVDYIYYTVLPYLCGATYVGAISPSPWSDDGPACFFTRFGEYFLDPAWQPYPGAEEAVTVDAPWVWAGEITTWRKLDDGRVQVVVPVVNRHPRQRLMETQNRFSEVPARLDGPVAVSVRPPEGFEGATPETWVLTCEPATAAVRVDAAVKEGKVAFKLDGLGLFKVAVLDFRARK